MTVRRAVIGLCMLCALFTSAVAAQSAMAITGTTGFTCKKKTTEGGVGFSREHCKPSDAVSTGAKYEHVVIPEGTTTELSGTNAKTTTETIGAVRTSLIIRRAGVAFTFDATEVSGSGTMVNKKAASGEHYAEGEGVITYKGLSVTLPTGQTACVFKDKNGVAGQIVTETLKATTQGQGDFLKFEPKAGTTANFIQFSLSSCPLAVLNGTYGVSGSVLGVPDGATVNFTEAETLKQETLKSGGQNAGLEGSLTLSTRANSTQAYTPLSTTTITT